MLGSQQESCCCEATLPVHLWAIPLTTVTCYQDDKVHRSPTQPCGSNQYTEIKRIHLINTIWIHASHVLFAKKNILLSNRYYAITRNSWNCLWWWYGECVVTYFLQLVWLKLRLEWDKLVCVCFFFLLWVSFQEVTQT